MLQVMGQDLPPLPSCLLVLLLWQPVFAERLLLPNGAFESFFVLVPHLSTVGEPQSWGVSQVCPQMSLLLSQGPCCPELLGWRKPLGEGG